MSNRIVIVCGAPGAGKTSVVEAAIKKYKVFSQGGLMLDVGIKKGYVKHRDEIRFLTNQQTTELRTQTFTDLSKMEGNIVLDTHASVEQHNRYIPGLPFGQINILKTIAGFIYIDADTDAIIERRKKDKTRIREEEGPEVINMQRTVNIAVLSYYASYFNAPLYIIDNKAGKLEESRKEFLNQLKDAFATK